MRILFNDFKLNEFISTIMNSVFLKFVIFFLSNYNSVVLFFLLLYNTYTNQSTAKSKETSWTGASMAVSTINISTSAALGTLADAMLAAVEVRLQSSKTKRRNSSLKQAACLLLCGERFSKDQQNIARNSWANR